MGRVVLENLIAAGWRTPNTYSGEYDEIPDEPGIYAFVLIDRHWWRPLRPNPFGYVGKSLRLARRLSGHAMVRAIKSDLPSVFVQTWFLRLPAAEIGAAEVAAIQQLNPLYNLVGKRRGVSALQVGGA